MPPSTDIDTPRKVGRYLLHHEIASGGMASVYLGQLIGPVGFSRVVAVKRMLRAFAQDPRFLEMFVDEVRLTTRVQHPNVVRTLDVVEQGGEMFLVMEYVRGDSVAGLIKSLGGPFPAGVAGTIASQVLSGLAAAHSATDEDGRPLDIIHRDVTPQNILVGIDGQARIADFGIAKAASRVHVTRDGEVKGKLSYIPPEQFVGAGAIDRTADIYSLGVVVWEMLAGAKLFDGASLEEVITAKARGAVPSLLGAQPSLPAAVDDVIRRALAPKVSERFASAEDFQLAIEKVLPLYTPRQLGEWVETTASERLKKNRALIDLVEQEMRRPSLDDSFAGTDPEGEPTHADDAPAEAFPTIPDSHAVILRLPPPPKPAPPVVPPGQYAEGGTVKMAGTDFRKMAAAAGIGKVAPLVQGGTVPIPPALNSVTLLGNEDSTTVKMNRRDIPGRVDVDASPDDFEPTVRAARVPALGTPIPTYAAVTAQHRIRRNSNLGLWVMIAGSVLLLSVIAILVATR